ncbi:MAG: ORF6C domain-containing protein [Clostridiales bacterium]|nr:ORF6C domain-containing protein [Clostridiales bacterium]
MDERLTKLENTMTIDYAQQQSITKAVNKAVTKVLGGKQSNAYHEVGKKVFAECNRDIKDFFCVNARNNIPKAKFQNAMEYIEKWTPSTNTKLLINECNAQMCLQ